MINRENEFKHMTHLTINAIFLFKSLISPSNLLYKEPLIGAFLVTTLFSLSILETDLCLMILFLLCTLLSLAVYKVSGVIEINESSVT